MMKNCLFKAIVLTFITIFSIEISAQTKISVQGVIRKSDGNAIEDGLYPITFKLYNVQINGSELWSETQPDVKVTSGIYSTLLGNVTPLDLAFDEYYYLSITIEGEELTPRAPLTSAPYTNSLIGFDNLFPSSGNVGIGSSSPSHKLEVEGSATINGNFLLGDSIIFVDTIGREINIGIAEPNRNAGIQLHGGFTQYNRGIANGTAYINQLGGTDINGNGAFGHLTVGIVGASGDAIVYQRSGRHLGFGTNDILRMHINENGNVGIGFTNINSSPSHVLHVNGVARSSSSTWATSSDVRVKENIKSLENGALSQILKLRPVHYDWKQEYFDSRDGLKQNNTGFIAQEVKEVFPEMVSNAKEEIGTEVIEDFHVLNLSDLPVHLVKAIQEQQLQIEVLKNENLALKHKLEDFAELYKSTVVQLEDKINQVLKIQTASND